jgi:hypothetical protein
VFSTKVNLSGLSLVVGLALLEVLRGYGIMGLELKKTKESHTAAEPISFATPDSG